MNRSAFRQLYDQQLAYSFHSKATNEQIDGFIRSYQNYDGQASYVVDCRSMEYLYVSPNFGKMTGYPGIEMDGPVGIFQEIKRGHDQKVIHGIRTRIGITTNYKGLWNPERDTIKEIFELKNGRMILRLGTMPLFDANGVTTLNVSRYMDITGLIPSGKYKAVFSGPNAERFEAIADKTDSFRNILTRQEQKILSLLGLGMTSKQIAEKLFVSKHTVDTHRRNILKKLEATNSPQAFSLALDMGLIHRL